MPGVATVAGLLHYVAEFVVADVDLAIEPAALADARRSLTDSGLLLLGEVHGVRENPLLIRALMQAFGLTCLALEWPDDLAPVIETFLADGTQTDHRLLWSGDGRITAGHLAVLAERAAAGPLDLILFDGMVGPRCTWSQRDEAMARRILAAAMPGTRMLAVAGNAHTPTHGIEWGMPMGAFLVRQRQGVRDIRISYGGGSFYNAGPRRFQPAGLSGQIVLHQEDGAIVLGLPTAREAVVPHRPSGVQPEDGFLDVGIPRGGERGLGPDDGEACLLQDPQGPGVVAGGASVQRPDRHQIE